MSVFGSTLRTPVAVVVSLVLTVFFAPTADSVQEQRRPLLLEGKTTLYQRVLTRPGARLQTDPTTPKTAAANGVPPFSVYYVYDRKIIEDVEWLELGAKRYGATDGWLAADLGVDWKQTLTVAFTNPAGRKPALLFRDKKSLLDLLESETLYAESVQLRAAIEQGNVSSDFPVVSVEPDTYVDFEEQFYLLPILSHEEIWLSSGFRPRLLEIASVPLGGGSQETLEAPSVRGRVAKDALPTNTEGLEKYRMAVAFVIDTTISMQPYIDSVRNAVQQVYKKVEKAGLLSKFTFALVAYRDNTGTNPGLEYVAKVFADMKSGNDPRVILEKVGSVSEAAVSSRGFIEDAYAGVLTALDLLEWQDYDGRILILITDAGARRANDPFGQTGLGAEGIRRIARDKGVFLQALHLLTPEGRPNHRSAEAQYTQLTEIPGVGPLYHAIDAGSVEDYEQWVKTVSADLLKQVSDAIQGKITPPPKRADDLVAAGSVTPVSKPSGGGVGNTKLEESRRKVQFVGHIMQLAYLGRERGSQAPSLLRAWAVDRDLENPDTATLEVRVLLSRNQLSDLQEALKAILEGGKAAQGTSSRDFFNQVKSAAAAMGRDPSLVGREVAGNLADLGLMGEYLDGLPYQTKVMTISEDLWHDWDARRQQEFIDELAEKVREYDRYHDDTDRWITLTEGAAPGDEVYPIPLEALP